MPALGEAGTMETTGSLYCPVAMAAHILEPRWTMLVLCELTSGARRFSEIQKALPAMSPSLLTRRLRELRDHGMVERHEGADGQIAYMPTGRAEALAPVLEALGRWAHAHVDLDVQLRDIDERPMMWAIRRKLAVRALPRARATIRFRLRRSCGESVDYWIVARPNVETDLCSVDPRQEVDLYVAAELRAFTAAWMGHTTFAAEIEAGRIELIGDAAMASALSRWLIRSSFAGDPAPKAA